MDCPLCDLPMHPQLDREVEIDVCANHHVFFDKHELGEHAARGRRREDELRAAAIGGSPGDRRCPRCGAAMIPLEHRETRAELCTGCEGVLLWRSSVRSSVSAVDAGVVAAGVSDFGNELGSEIVDGLFEAGFELVLELLAGLLDP